MGYCKPSRTWKDQHGGGNCSSMKESAKGARGGGVVECLGVASGRNEIE